MTSLESFIVACSKASEFRCEEIFGFEKLSGYETGRIYAYLAERYLPFWFKKYSKIRTWPIYFLDKMKFR